MKFEDYLISLMEAVPIALVSLSLGYLGAWAHSYFSQKGKNLATKEDIEDITNKIESVKAKLNHKSQKTNAILSRQLIAFDDISEKLHRVRMYALCEDEFIIHETISKNDFLKSISQLRETCMKNDIYVSREIHEAIDNITDKASEIYKTNTPTSTALKDFSVSCGDVLVLISKEIFSNE